MGIHVETARRLAKIHQSLYNFKDRRVILAIPLGSNDARDARHTVGMLEDALAWLKSDLFATILAPGVMERGVVRDHPDVLAMARQTGREAIEK
jgi:hypothetical protein